MKRSVVIWILVWDSLLSHVCSQESFSSVDNIKQRTVRQSESDGYSPGSGNATEPGPELGSNSDQSGLPEPGPKWSQAFKTWKWAWPFHVYLFCALYLLVTMVSSVYLAIEFWIRKLEFNSLKIGLYTSLACFSITRAVLLFVNPYNSEGPVSSGVVVYVVWAIGLPSILCTFTLLLLALVDTTRIQLTPPRFQNLFTVTFISISNLIIVISSELLAIYFLKKVLTFLCQVYLFIFGLTLSLGFLYVAFKITNMTNSVLPRGKIRRLRCLIYMSAAVGVCLVSVQVFSATAVFGVLSDENEVSPWLWLTLQTCMRSVELVMCVITMLVFKRTTARAQDVGAYDTQSRAESANTPV